MENPQVRGAIVNGLVNIDEKIIIEICICNTGQYQEPVYSTILFFAYVGPRH